VRGEGAVSAANDFNQGAAISKSKFCERFAGKHNPEQEQKAMDSQ